MPIGVLNPSDTIHSPSTRPTRANTGVNQRRWFSNALTTEVRDQDLNDLLAQIRFAVDFYSVADTEGDDSLLQKAIAAGASSLTGNIRLLQQLVGGADKVPYFTSAAAMNMFVATAFSRTLLAMTNSTQWRDALGISAVTSDNVVAFGDLPSSANTIGYFTGTGTMALTNLTSFARTILDDADAATVRATLLLGTAATHPSTDFAVPADLATKANIASPALTGIPTVPTPATADNSTTIASTAYVKSNLAALGISNISGLQAALDLKAPLASPALTGTPTAPTATTATNTTQIATTAYVKSNLTSYATLASPALTGTPTAPTAAAGTNTTQLATTAYVQTAVATSGGSFQPLDADLTTLSSSTAYFLTLSDDPDAATARGTLGLGTSATHPATDFATPADVALKANIASPALTGVPTAPTASTPTNTTQLATTAFVKNVVGGIAVADVSGLQAALDLKAPLASPGFTGTPSAPTPATASNSTLIATTAFVQSNLASYAPLSGATFTGSVLVSPGASTAATIAIDKPDPATLGVLDFRSATVNRWRIRTTVNAESGGSVGSDLQLIAYDDAGVQLSVPLTITRATGILAFASSPTAPTPAAADNSTKMATTAFVAAGIAAIFGVAQVFTASVTVANDLLVDRTGGAANASLYLRGDAGQARRILGQTGTVLRWQMLLGNTTAEGGANAGSNFQLAAYDDTGTLIGSPLVITRSTQVAAFSASPTAPTPTAGDNSTQLATTAFVATSFATLASPALTGTPTAPTAAAGNASTRIATTAFVANSFAPLASPVLTGTPTAPTAAAGDNSTTLATTGFVATSFAPLAGPFFTGAITGGSVIANTGSITTSAGSLIVDRTGDAANAALIIRADAGSAHRISATTAGLNRWQLDIGNTTAEGGANAGTNFVLTRYDDAGASIDNPLTITRSTGIMALTQSPTAPTPAQGDNSTKLATTAYVMQVVHPTSNKSAAYTFAAADSTSTIFYTGAGAVNFTAPDEATAVLPIGFFVDVIQYGAGKVTIVGGTGVTIRGRGGLVGTNGQYARIRAYKRTATEWIVSGDIA
jgi:hypothetical protein